MRKRLGSVVLGVLLLCSLSSGVALAAPRITGSGISNRVAWGVSALKTARVWVKTDVAGAYAIIDILSGTRVVKTLYSGPAAAPGVRRYSPAWGGTNTAGAHLPTGTYKYRLRITKGGVTATATGAMPVSHNYFKIAGGWLGQFTRYLYKGKFFASYRVLCRPGYSEFDWVHGPPWASRRADFDGVSGNWYNPSASSAWSPTFRYSSIADVAGRYYFTLNRDVYPDSLNGAWLELTVIQ